MAWEWLEKYLRGKQGQDLGIYGPDRYVEPTQGLFGTGGQYGAGGLLTTQPENPGGGMLNLFSNLPVVTGLEILQGGMTGKPIEQTLLPAFKSGLVTTSAVEKVKAAKRKQEFIKEYKDQVPPEDMEMFLAFPKEYMGGLISKKFRTTKRTVSDEILAVYDRVKGLTGTAFNVEFAKFSKAEKALYKNKIEGNEDFLDAATAARMEQLNTPIVLNPDGGVPDESTLSKFQTYQIGVDANGNPKYFRWDGKDMKRIPPPL